MNITEITAASTAIQGIQASAKKIALPNNNATTTKIPIKAANEAEAKHTLQYLLLRQKTPPITKNPLGTISNRIVGTMKTGIKEKVLTNPVKRMTTLITPNAPNIINIMPAAFLILPTLPLLLGKNAF